MKKLRRVTGGVGLRASHLVLLVVHVKVKLLPPGRPRPQVLPGSLEFFQGGILKGLSPR